MPKIATLVILVLRNFRSAWWELHSPNTILITQEMRCHWSRTFERQCSNFWSLLSFSWSFLPSTFLSFQHLTAFLLIHLGRLTCSRELMCNANVWKRDVYSIFTSAFSPWILIKTNATNWGKVTQGRFQVRLYNGCNFSFVCEIWSYALGANLINTLRSLGNMFPT